MPPPSLVQHESEAAATLSYRTFASICRCPLGPVWTNCPEKVPALIYMTLRFGTASGDQAPPMLSAADPVFGPLQPLGSMTVCLSRNQCRLPDMLPLACEARIIFILLALAAPLSMTTWASARCFRGSRARFLSAPLVTACAALAGIALRRVYALQVIGDALVVAAALHCVTHATALARGERPPLPHLVMALYAFCGAWCLFKASWLDPNRCVDLIQCSGACLAFSLPLAALLSGRSLASLASKATMTLAMPAVLGVILVHVASSVAQGSAWC